MLFSPDIMIDMFTKYGGMFMKGAGMALLLSLITIVISMIFGTLVALARMSKIAPLRWLVSIYIEIFRSTPLMVQVMVIYFGAAAMGWKIQVPFMRDFNSFFWGLLCLILNSSAYVAEIVRGGILSVDRGQTEAGRSLGFSAPSTMLYIILPQAAKSALPALCNEFIALIKETSILSYIALTELTKAGDYIRSRTYSAFTPYIISGLLYLLVTVILTKGIGRLERRLRNSER